MLGLIMDSQRLVRKKNWNSYPGFTLIGTTIGSLRSEFNIDAIGPETRCRNIPISKANA